MPRYHVYLKTLGDTPVSVAAEQTPDLAAREPWVRIGNSWFLSTEIVAVVADTDLAPPWRSSNR